MEEFVKVLGDKPEPVGQAARRQLRPEGLAQLPARAADHRSRPAQQHQRRHPLPRLLAGRQRLRAHPQPDGRRRHRRDHPLAGLAVGGARRRASSTTAARSPPKWCKALIPEELAKVKATVTAQGEDTATYDQAAGIFEKMSLAAGLSGVPDAAAVRGDGLSRSRAKVSRGDTAPGATREPFSLATTRPRSRSPGMASFGSLALDQPLAIDLAPFERLGDDIAEDWRLVGLNEGRDRIVRVLHGHLDAGEVELDHAGAEPMMRRRSASHAARLRPCGRHEGRANRSRGSAGTSRVDPGLRPALERIGQFAFRRRIRRGRTCAAAGVATAAPTRAGTRPRAR